MKWRKILLFLGLCSLLGALAGCCCGGGSDSTNTVIEKQPVNTTPLGDELIKLKEAYDKGAMTEKEYEEQKAKLLKGQ